MKNKLLPIIIFVLIVFTVQLQAVGILYNRPLGSSAQYLKMSIKSVDVFVNVQDQIAVTHVDQVFTNELGTTVEAIYIFPLPENAMITELVYWFNGQRYVAEIRESGEARKIYDDKIREYLDPALLEYLGDNLFRLSIAPINGYSEVRTEISYVELLNYDFGVVHYKFLLNTLGLSPEPLESVLFEMNVQSQSPFKKLYSPTHKNSTSTQIQKISDYHYSVSYGNENYYPDKDFVLEFETIRDEVNFEVLTYTPVPEDSFGTDSFYALWITPPDSLTEDEIIPKDVVFTADVSGSMEGDRIRQLKEALNFFVDLLSPQDRFNIITFGYFAVKFKPNLVYATEQNIALAHDFIFQMYADGLTNFSDALNASLSQSFADSTSKNIIFLTDGQPTVGITHPDSILAHAAEDNIHQVRIFTFGVGDNISHTLLTLLSRQNYGYPAYITSDDSIALVVNNHFTRISKPVLTNIGIDMGGLTEWDRYPKTLNDLYWGSQLLQMGLYTNSGTFNLVLSGDIRSDSVQYFQQKTFTDTLGGHRFVPRLWAKSKIDHLMEAIEIYGESDELVNQIIELSLRFQILTPYTAFIADPTTEVDEENDVELPNNFTLSQNYPNPFNSSTEIKYNLLSLKSSYHVVIKIYDVQGRLVKVLVDKTQAAGSYSISWDGTDLTGNAVASGIYFYSMQVGEFKSTQKMMLLR